MSKSPIINQYYNNTSFSTEEQTSLQSSFLGFGQTFSIALNLFKKRISNLFLPVLIWQLLLFIVFLFVEGILIFGISKSVPLGSGLYIPNLIDPKTFEVTKELNQAVVNIMSLPGAVGFSILMLLVLIGYLIINTWIDLKKSIMINDTGIKMLDSNVFIKRFWVIVLFLICQSILFNIVTSALDKETTPGLNFILSVLSLVFSLVFVYLDIVVKYICNIYLIEKSDFWSSFKAVLANVRKFLGSDFLRHLIFILIMIGVVVIAIIIFGLLSLGLLVPLADKAIVNGTTGVVLLILFSVLILVSIVCILALSWVTEAFVYVAYYNLRMLDIHNYSDNYNYDNLPKVVENESQTLEEKLMQNKNIEANSTTQFVSESNNKTTTTQPLSESVDIEQNQEALAEYNLMDVGQSTKLNEETKPQPTIINPAHSSILGISKIKKSNSSKDDFAATTTVSSQTDSGNESVAKTPTFSSLQKDDLQIIDGIGPKIEELLNNNGIYSWLQLADTSVEKLNEILDNAGSRFSIHNPLNWPRQATLARDGKMDELAALKVDLVRGA